jgi:hypothetical protein
MVSLVNFTDSIACEKKNNWENVSDLNQQMDTYIGLM